MTDAVERLNATEVSIALAPSKRRSDLLKREMPGLDALRGIAVLSVVLYHGLFWQLPDAISPSLTKLSRVFTFGWLGVSLFFILSGFLITGILLDTRNKPHSMKNFYVRRALRILPLCTVSLIWFALVVPTNWRYIAFCILNLANMAQYFPSMGRDFSPLWSLAVEEQFYLVWPWLTRRLILRPLAYLSLAMVAICPLLRMLSEMRMPPLGDPHTMTWLIADNFAVGGLVAIFLRSRFSTPANVRKLMLGLFGLFVVLFGIGVRFNLLHRGTVLGAGFQPEPFHALFAGLLLAALSWGDRPMVLKLTAPLRFLGYISYGVYMFHMLLFAAYAGLCRRLGIELPQIMSLGAGLARFAVVFAECVLICFVSRRYFEEYFLRLKSKLAPNVSGGRVVPN